MNLQLKRIKIIDKGELLGNISFVIEQIFRFTIFIVVY